MRVAQYLQRNGYDAANVDGGMLAWAQARPTGGDRRRRTRARC